MGDMGDDFRAMREQTRQHRKKMLETANTEGWTRHTDWHYSRVINGVRVDWWPSGGKAKVGDRMIYGHRKVNATISKMLIGATADLEPCGCRQGECESKSGRRCRMVDEVARDAMHRREIM